jgi:protoporphyrinogen oxidase
MSSSNSDAASADRTGKRVAVIGAGAMGLAAALYLLKAGHRVDVFEADDRPGGMAAHFDLDGLDIERFYHFICKADRPTFALLDELGIADKLRWRETSMGYFCDGKLYPWGTPLALLGFPLLDPISKFRYGLHMFLLTRRTRWTDLDALHADDWLQARQGRRAWKVLWERLFTLKFFEYSHDISAAWVWARIKRLGTSRRSLMQEELGYLEGGSQTLVHALVARIEALGGKVHLRCPTSEIRIEGGRVTGVAAGGAIHGCDAAISTIPFPRVPDMIPGLPEAIKAKYRGLPNIGVVCVVHKLRRGVSTNFWVNINDERIDVPGIVEFSNLRDVGDVNVVYVPYYMPPTHPKFQRDNDFFIQESFGYLRLLNPALVEGDRIASHVGRLRYAQPVCSPGFLASLPPMAGVIDGLQIADTSVYYPEDRGISESVRIAALLAAGVR